MNTQKTIAQVISLKGTGLHTAHKVNITFKPAQEDAGIKFIRIDLPNKPVIQASVDNLVADSGTYRCSAIGADGVEILTIEHLMAALKGLEIDNILVEIDNDEVPGLDGSSQQWVELFIKAGIKELKKEAKFYAVKEPIFVEEDGAVIAVFPDKDFKVSYTLDYNHAYLKTGFLGLTVTKDSFKEGLSGARTFCLEEEALLLQQQGLGKGATYDNTLVIGKNGVIKNNFRFTDECLRHKILDLVGDLYLLGEPIKGHVIALKSGHSLNMKLLRKIEQQKKRYEMGALSIKYPKESLEELDINEIMNVLPHRYPFLLVDRILSLQRGKFAIGIKNVTMNEYFFQGHFPGKPVMPGVLIIEAMAQVGGVMMLSTEENRGKIAYFMCIKDAKFRKTVVPGDQLIMEIEAGKIKSRMGQVFGKALVDGKVVAEAELMFAFAD